MSTPKSNAPRPFVFVVMPFAEKFSDTYEVAIKPACTSAGAHCERADEQIHSEPILSHVLNQIAKADLIVAVMTSRNPNVYYEVGYAHALGKHVILLTDNASDIPFDLAHHLHIVYGNSLSRLKTTLEQHVAHYLSQPRIDADLVPAVNLQFFHEGSIIEDGSTIEIGAMENVLNFHLDIHNPSSVGFAGGKVKFAAIASERLKELSKNAFSMQLPDGRNMTELPGFSNIFPGGWGVLRFQLARPRGQSFVTDEKLPLILRVFTEIGPRDFKFFVKPDPRQRRGSFYLSEED